MSLLSLYQNMPFARVRQGLEHILQHVRVVDSDLILRWAEDIKTTFEGMRNELLRGRQDYGAEQRREIENAEAAVATGLEALAHRVVTSARVTLSEKEFFLQKFVS
jgi:hypothetical protein